MSRKINQNRVVGHNRPSVWQSTKNISPLSPIGKVGTYSHKTEKEPGKFSLLGSKKHLRMLQRRYCYRRHSRGSVAPPDKCAWLFRAKYPVRPHRYNFMSVSCVTSAPNETETVAESGAPKPELSGKAELSFWQRVNVISSPFTVTLRTVPASSRQ